MAADAGLPTMPTRLTISRNQSSSWQPWTKAYIAIQPAMAEVEVLVDGQDRGAAPQVVEVGPGRAASTGAEEGALPGVPRGPERNGRGQGRVRTELTANPRSIKIVTSIPGVEVDIDGEQKLITPAVFENVAAGTHVVHLRSLGASKRVYLGGDPFPVEVKPDEQTPVTRTMIEGTGHLTIADAPTGSSLAIDGVPVESAGAFTSGMEAPAGELDVAVNGPGGQKWTQTINLGLSAEVKESVYSMAWHLQRRTIQMDGNPGDWEGLMPVWIPERQTFPDHRAPSWYAGSPAATIPISIFASSLETGHRARTWQKRLNRNWTTLRPSTPAAALSRRRRGSAAARSEGLPASVSMIRAHKRQRASATTLSSPRSEKAPWRSRFRSVSSSPTSPTV